MLLQPQAGSYSPDLRAGPLSDYLQRKLETQSGLLPEDLGLKEISRRRKGANGPSATRKNRKPYPKWETDEARRRAMEEALEARQAGEKISTIAEALGVTERTVRLWLRKMGLSGKPFRKTRSSSETVL
ncbi:helix-turn-helix domain-containing protein [Thermosulfurimonas sp. F29]|uniref:helix-turn-helix domain-containing protein n=1 Tax=Thermosulfurimonas sp. F29 TaxID=2867247 RepID=UPI001C834195|nr:helix-turn-helix domain-containing protein [Thermosulfurimonas sp. F29]MBX6423441.1 helix-turn-helix domain-containing protein [Thermosulfurimonas sp. F29]